MGMNTYPEGVSYTLIKKASQGDQQALAEILRLYEPFHNALASYDIIGPDGKPYQVVNEDWKIQVQMKLADAIQTKWRELI